MSLLSRSIINGRNVLWFLVCSETCLAWNKSSVNSQLMTWEPIFDERFRARESRRKEPSSVHFRRWWSCAIFNFPTFQRWCYRHVFSSALFLIIDYDFWVNFQTPKLFHKCVSNYRTRYQLNVSSRSRLGLRSPSGIYSSNQIKS